MVTAIAQPALNSPLLGDTTGSLALRVQGTEHDGRILHIRSPKCLIGSDPSCTLRLRSTTVRPFHCLILRGTEGTFIRRWSPDTCLNGSGFDEARLSPGDRISIGAIELEVLPSTSRADAARGIEPPPENDPKDTPLSESAQECQRLRDELDDLRQEYERLQLAIEQQTQKDQEAEALREELDGLRHQLHEELRLAGNSRGHLEAELEFRSQQLFDVQTQLAALQCSRDEQFAQWQSHEKQWHEELEATRAQGEAFQREIESLRFQATEAAARAADHEVSPPVAGDNAADIATWKDVAEGLRRELQQTRDEHRRVREEWHVDRQNLERELNARSTAAQNLEQKYKQDMREAEVLIHAMQQEGKHLLIQLDEAKQSIRQGTEGNKKKRPSLVHTVRSLVVDGALPAALAATQAVPHNPPAALAATQAVPHNPPAEQPTVAPSENPRPLPQSACPTMLMSSQLAFDEPESPPSPAAELTPVEPHVPTLALNPDDLPRVIVTPVELLAEESPSGMAADPPLAEHPAADASLAATHDQEPEDDEHVIQRYMERLLRRVARVPDDQNTPTHVAAAVQAVVHTPRPESAPAVESAANTAEPAAKHVEPSYEPVRDVPAPAAAPELCPVKEAEARPARVTPLASKPLAKPRDVIPPELAADLLAMRELANRTARRDIDRSDDRRNTVAAAGEIAVASVCLVSGALASALSSSFFSAEAIGGAMGISFGAIFLIRGLRTCIRLRKKSSEARKDAGT